MTSRQRIRAAFSGEPVDRVPIYCAGMHGRIASHVLGREAFYGFGIQGWREAMALWQGPDAHAEFLERLGMPELIEAQRAGRRIWND